MKARWLAAAVVAAGIVAWTGMAMTDTDVHAEAANLDFTLKDMHGADVRLADFRGRPIIMNFWATWCGPCKAEIPALVALTDQYRDQQLTVLGISVDDAPEDLRPFASAFKINYPVLVGLGHDRLQETYDAVMWVPITWFIRPDGTVHLKHQGPATKEWFETQIKAMLAPAPESE
jgi:cytochrome c biogenesis protein CcmG/thiol:disulfide interchange protein DsbE